MPYYACTEEAVRHAGKACQSIRGSEVDALRQKHVERARYEAELKRRRFLKCDPNHRLVADALEAEWNEALRHLESLTQ